MQLFKVNEFVPEIIASFEIIVILINFYDRL